MERKEIACHYFLSRRNYCLSTGRDYACTKGIVKLINRSAPGMVRAPPKVSGCWSTIDRLRYHNLVIIQCLYYWTSHWLPKNCAIPEQQHNYETNSYYNTEGLLLHCLH